MRSIVLPLFFTVSLLPLISCSSRIKQEAVNTAAVTPLSVEVRSQVDKSIATTGDLINYTITVTSDPQIDVVIPEAGSQIAGLRIVDLGEEGPQEIDNRQVLKKWYKLRADLAGSYIIPSLTVPYKDTQGKEQELKTAQIFVEVTSALRKQNEGEVQDIIDIKPLRELPRDLTPFLIAGAVVTIFIVGGVVLFFFIRSRKKKTDEILKPAHILAFEELEQLRQDQLVEKGVIKEHFFRLSEIFRRYIERRFRIPAIEQTTEELVPAIINLDSLGTSLKAETRSFLQQADLVKFAKFTPEKNQIEGEYQKVVKVIQETKEAIPAVEAAEKYKQKSQGTRKVDN